MMTEFSNQINELKDQMEELNLGLKGESCIKKEPFIKLGSGQAPVLNYNIPQTACFTTYGSQFVKGISQEAFLAHTKEAPAQNYFEVVANTPEPQLRQRFAEAIQLQRTDDVLIPGSAILRKHISLAESNLKAVALAATPATIELEGKSLGDGPILAQEAFIFDKANALNEVQLARLAKEGLRPMVIEKLGGYETEVKYVKEPAQPIPYFAVIEEYTTCSFLGDYGAGKTVKTFSLLPGEKTTITVRTYKEKTTTQTHSENVLDSFGESSTNELEQLIENETGLSNSTTNDSSTTATSSKSGSVSANIGGLLLKVVQIGVNGKTEWGSSQSSTNSTSATRASNVRSLNKAVDKHVSNSNANRSIEINTSTSESYTEGEEISTVREIANINKSRVLNFVFRQLLQQYVTITYLSNIKIAFCNGYEESLRVVDLEELDILLEDTIQTGMIEQIRQTILKHYCTVFNYKDEPIPFVEKVTYSIGECVDANEEETFWRIKKNITDTWQEDDEGLLLKVNGPILNVSKHTLKTDSAVVDAVLGQGEALDCYNMKIQEADAWNEQLRTLEHLQQLVTLQSITDPEQRAELYKKVFGTCCDTPQTQIIP